MTPEQWNRIEELYHAAMALPAEARTAFLHETGEDMALRREVESLLNGETREAGLLDGPALITPANIAAEVTDTAMVGRTIGGYHLESLLGAGAWARSTGRATTSWVATSRSRCCHPGSPGTRIGSPASNARRGCWRR